MFLWRAHILEKGENYSFLISENQNSQKWALQCRVFSEAGLCNQNIQFPGIHSANGRRFRTSNEVENAHECLVPSTSANSFTFIIAVNLIHDCTIKRRLWLTFNSLCQQHWLAVIIRHVIWSGRAGLYKLWLLSGPSTMLTLSHTSVLIFLFLFWYLETT